MKDVNKKIGEKISFYRKRLKLSQQEFANLVDIAKHQTISDIEKGVRELKAYELSKFARVLRVNTTDLLMPEKNPNIPQVIWRDEPEDYAIKEADFRKHCEDYFLLEKFCNSHLRKPLPQKIVDFHSTDYDDATKLAGEIQQEFNLGSCLADNLENVLQKVFNVKIFYADLGNIGNTGSAASTISDFGAAILMNKNEAPWRRNFSFGHELFHLITWDSIPPELKHKNPDRWEKIEKLANVFASSLLLPEQPISYAFSKCVIDNKIKYIDLIQIAREFSVSSIALIYRLKILKHLNQNHITYILNDPKFKELDKNTMHENWWETPELPERFVRLAFTAYQNAKISRTRMAELLGKSLLTLKDFLEGYSWYEDEEESYETEMCIA